MLQNWYIQQYYIYYIYNNSKQKEKQYNFQEIYKMKIHSRWQRTIQEESQNITIKKSEIKKEE